MSNFVCIQTTRIRDNSGGAHVETLKSPQDKGIMGGPLYLTLFLKAKCKEIAKKTFFRRINKIGLVIRTEKEKD